MSAVGGRSRGLRSSVLEDSKNVPGRGLSLGEQGDNLGAAERPNCGAEEMEKIGPLELQARTQSQRPQYISSASSFHGYGGPQVMRPVDASQRLKSGVPGKVALRNNKANLTRFEQQEIIHYDFIYYVGKYSSKIRQGNNGVSFSGAAPNFTDPSGNYTVLPGDHLAYRYEVLSMLGKGSFGAVYKCKDHANDCLVAVKICSRKGAMVAHAKHECSVLDFLHHEANGRPPSIVKMYTYFRFRGHICIVFEALEKNLYEHMKMLRFSGCREHFIKCVAIQMLTALRYLRSKQVIHCDIKPENILLARMGSSMVKLIDFGSSCFEQKPLYTYVQSRYYRAPEVLLGLQYGFEVDIWSLGCVLAEMALGDPIFAGENEGQQLYVIASLLGPPPHDMVKRSPKKSIFFTADGMQFLSSCQNFRKAYRPYPPEANILKLLGACVSQTFADFVEKCLKWSPAERFKFPDEACNHPWLHNVKQHYMSAFLTLPSYELPHLD